MTRSSCAALSLLLAIALTSCGRSSNSTAPEATPSAAIAGPLPSNVALFDLWVDAESTSAEISPIHTATAQPPQNLSYDLDIARYITPQTLSVVAVRKNDFGDVVVRFRHAHPFPAPDFAAPISGKNRADLSYTGRLMILADENQLSLNSGTMTADPWVVRDVDGYAAVGDLLRDSVGLTNTHFPYMLLADEAKNNREGVSNGAQAIGNYDAASGGWQRANIGASGKGWTGFDYIHAGQAIQNEFTVRRETFTGSSWNVRLAVVIQYTDPRGAGGMDLRFPPEAVDVAQFAYRLPHAALDVSRVSGNWDLYMHPDAAAVTKLDFRVRDWDAQASVSADGDLSDEPDVAKIQPNGGGFPTVQLVMPDLVSSPLLLLRSSGSGVAGNEFRFQGDLSNPLGAVPGVYWGVLQVIDPEFGDPNREEYHYGVDPVTYTPDATRALEPITILPVRVTVAPATTSWGRSWGDRNPEAGGPAVVDSLGNVYVAGVLSQLGQDLQPEDTRHTFAPRGFVDQYISKFDPHGNRLWTAHLGASEAALFTHAFLMAPNDDLLVTFSLDQGAPVDLDPGPGTANILPPPGISQALARYSPDGLLRWVAQPEYVTEEGNILSDGILAAACAPDGSVYYSGNFSGTRDFDPSPGTALLTAQAEEGGSGAWLSRLDSNGQFDWVRDWGADSATAFNWIDNLAVRPDGNLALSGNLELDITDSGDSVDLDPTAGEDLWPGSFLGTAIVCTLTPDGDYLWGRGTGVTTPASGDLHGGVSYSEIAADDSNQLFLAGVYIGSVDLDPGPGTDPFDTIDNLHYECLVSYTPDGDYRWGFDLRGPDGDTLSLSESWITPDGNFQIVGAMFGDLDFDPGPGTRLLQPPGYLANMVAIYDPDGDFVYAEMLSNPGNLLPYDFFAPTPDGRILGAGSVRDGDDLEFGAGSQSLISEGGHDGFFAFLNERGEWE